MKTNRIYSALISLCLVIFMSTTGISNTAYSHKEVNLEKSGNRVTTSNTVSNFSASEFSYLRFDVNAYATESTIVELPVSSFDYLRFDVNDYTGTTGSEMTEMPVSNEFEYLRFDVTEYSETTGSEIVELPIADEFKYLRFDVNTYMNSDNSCIDQLLASE